MGFNKPGRAYTGKQRSELETLERRGMLVVGNAFSQVLVVKGGPGEAERGAAPLLGGADGAALRAAFAKLGYAPEDWCGLACWRADGGILSPDELRLAVTVLDPATVVVCDGDAAALMRAAYADELMGYAGVLEPGSVTMVQGMRALALGGFETALADAQGKQRAWAWLKQIPPLGDPY